MYAVLKILFGVPHYLKLKLRLLFKSKILCTYFNYFELQSINTTLINWCLFIVLIDVVHVSCTFIVGKSFRYSHLFKNKCSGQNFRFWIHEFIEKHNNNIFTW